MGSSNDDEDQDQDQQPSNFGPLALFGFMFWSMAGSSHGAEPTARPRPRPGGELKSLPLAPPTSLEVRRKGPALGDIQEALLEYTTKPVRDLFSRWRPAAFWRRAPASATSVPPPARQAGLLDAMQNGGDGVASLGREGDRAPWDVMGPAGDMGPAGYGGSVGDVGGSMAPWRSASQEGALTDMPRAACPAADRLGAVRDETPILHRVDSVGSVATERERRRLSAVFEAMSTSL